MSPPPCGITFGTLDCGYQQALQFGPDNCQDVRRNGHDRAGRRRYVCSFCDISFFETAPGEGIEDQSFRGYARLEAFTAVVYREEAIGDVARRLGVTPRTVTRWLNRMGRVGREMAKDEGWLVDVRSGRRSRRTGDTSIAPFVVSERDLHRYQKAVFGEVHHWVVSEEATLNRDLAALWDVVRDSDQAPTTRHRALTSARSILAELRPELM